jgi:hypothetical protein
MGQNPIIHSNAPFIHSGTLLPIPTIYHLFISQISGLHLCFALPKLNLPLPIFVCFARPNPTPIRMDGTSSIFGRKLALNLSLPPPTNSPINFSILPNIQSFFWPKLNLPLPLFVCFARANSVQMYGTSSTPIPNPN